MVVAADAGDGEGEFSQAAAPGAEAVTEDAKGIVGPTEGIAAVLLGMVGVVVDGVEESGRASASLPPGVEQGPGTPEWDLAYPPAV
ncbi:MAG: hypothetical protein M3Y73_01550 [Actinomycetota bacterium]|nr:hypothetical protein [Actinomycetota bacterium]